MTGTKEPQPEKQNTGSVEPLWRYMVCSEECFLRLQALQEGTEAIARSLGSTTDRSGNSSDVVSTAGDGGGSDGAGKPPAQPIKADIRFGANLSQSGAKVIPFTHRRRRAYSRPRSGYHIHLPKSPPESIASLIRIAENSGPESSFTHLVMGYILHNVGLYDRAIEELKEALRIDPRNDRARLQLGFVMERKGWRREAAGYFQELLDEQPEWAEARVGLGICLYATGEMESAIDQFNKALELEPGNLCAMLNKAVVYNNQGLYYLAEKVLKQIVGYEPECAEGHLYLGTIALQRGWLDEAILNFRRTIEIQNNHADAHYFLGEAFLRTGKRDAALVEFRKAVELNPSDPDGHYKKSILLLERGDVDEALNALNRTLELDSGDLEARFHLGMALSMQGDVDGALRELKAVQEVIPDLPEVNLGLAYLYYKRGQHDRAHRLFEEFKDARSDLADHLLRLAGLRK